MEQTENLPIITESAVGGTDRCHTEREGCCPVGCGCFSRLDVVRTTAACRTYPLLLTEGTSRRIRQVFALRGLQSSWTNSILSAFVTASSTTLGKGKGLGNSLRVLRNPITCPTSDFPAVACYPHRGIMWQRDHQSLTQKPLAT